MKHIKLFENFHSFDYAGNPEEIIDNPKEITIRMTDKFKSYLKQNGLQPADNSFGYVNPDKIELYDNSGILGASAITGEYNLVCIYTTPDSSEYNRDTVIRTWVRYDRVSSELKYYTSFFDFHTDRELNKANTSSSSPFFKNQYQEIDKNAQYHNQRITDSSKAKRDRINFFFQDAHSNFEDGIVVGAFDHGNDFEIIDIKK